MLYSPDLFEAHLWPGAFARITRRKSTRKIRIIILFCRVSLKNQHCVSIGKKTVTFVDRLLIGIQYSVPAGKGGNHYYQG